MELFMNYIRSHIKIAVDEIIRIGPVDFRLVSNISGFSALQFFSKTARISFQNQETEFELWCISLKDDLINQQYLVEHVDHTYRGKSFEDGYYVTDHFGTPIYLVTRGHRYFVFGEQLEHVVWPYFVKYFLMLHTTQKEFLFLKAAACVVGSAGTLLLGRGGAGKTVFLTQLCKNGAGFITNSHSLIKEGKVTGVASSIRIRPGYWFNDLIETVEKKPALKSEEIIIDPYDIFDNYSLNSVDVRNLCIIDFQQPGSHIIKEISEQDAYNYAEQFSLAINVYRLEEDLLDQYKGDYQKFSQTYIKMKTQLKALIQQCRCYYIGSDMLVEKNRDEIFDLLSK